MTTPPNPRSGQVGLARLPHYTKTALPLGPWETYRKTGTTEMTRINGTFVVETVHGPVICHDGWLAKDSAGYPYPIAAAEHDAIYELVEESAE